MSYFDRQRERESLRAMLDQIERGDIVLKHGADEVIAEIQQRLAGLERRDSQAPD